MNEVSNLIVVAGNRGYLKLKGGRYCTFPLLSENEYQLRAEETLSTLNDYLETLPDLVDTDPVRIEEYLSI